MALLLAAGGMTAGVHAQTTDEVVAETVASANDYVSLLPIVFATMAGLRNVSESYIEVGKGMGMTKKQILWKIQLPLAIPVILSGMRTALIICIGAATLAFSTGAGGLGLLIQTGCSTYNTVYIMEGTIPICVIAILMDQILRKIEKHAYRTAG